MAKRTRTEQNIEQVAGCIYDAAQVMGEIDEAYVRRVNETDGFSFEVNYVDEDYPGGPDRSWTRVEGLRLSEPDLERAIALARRWPDEGWADLADLLGEA